MTLTNVGRCPDQSRISGLSRLGPGKAGIYCATNAEGAGALVAIDKGMGPDMTRDEVFGRYAAEAARVLGVDKSRITYESRFAEDLGADSLDIIEIMVFMEEDLNVAVRQELLNDVKTVGQVVDLLCSQS